jgi:uncharacterized membrane protein (UPF0127 family)
MKIAKLNDKFPISNFQEIIKTLCGVFFVFPIKDYKKNWHLSFEILTSIFFIYTNYAQIYSSACPHPFLPARRFS